MCSIVVYKLCVLCCRSLKAGSFLIFVCLALRSLGNLHKSQKAFTELGWIEVAALVCFCIILTTRITQNRHPRKVHSRQRNKQKYSLVFISFVYVLLFSLFSPFPSSQNLYLSVFVVFLSLSPQTHEHTHSNKSLRWQGNRCTLLFNTLFIPASQCVVGVFLLMQAAVHTLEQLIIPNEGASWSLNGC